MPRFISDSGKDFLSKIFVTDPEKRIDIEEIREHPWYKLHQPETQSFGAERNLGNINMQIVKQLEDQLHFNSENLIKSIKSNRHNHLTATYYLLLKRQMMKLNKPYLESFLSPETLTLKYSRLK
jgi:5'-AMP-activated protein kinase catalytic alpha subunit